jgi:aldehyde:ferredoxin oxidoreductase
MTCALDATGLCLFTITALELQDIIPMLIAVTGTGFETMQFLTVGERIFNLQRLFNLRAGLQPENERLPERFYKEPLPDGPNAGAVLNLEQAMAEYSNLRGWDTNRIPYMGKLEKLGLAEYSI